MPKREREYLYPLNLPRGCTNAAWLFAILQTLDPKQDLAQNEQVVVIVGPKEWQKFIPITKKSVQTMKRWLKTLEQLGLATVERISKDTHRVTIHYVPVEKGHRHGHTKETQGQGYTAQ